MVLISSREAGATGVIEPGEISITCCGFYYVYLGIAALTCINTICATVKPGRIFNCIIVSGVTIGWTMVDITKKGSIPYPLP